MHDDDGHGDIAGSSTSIATAKAVQRKRLDVDADGVCHDPYGDKSTQKQCVTSSDLASIHVLGRVHGSRATASNHRTIGRQPTISRGDVFPKASLWSSSAVATAINSKEDQQSVIAYPGIPFQVAKFLCESNPEIVERMEAALHNSLAGTKASPAPLLNAAASTAAANVGERFSEMNGIRGGTSFNQMAFVTDALALQHSVIGGLGEALRDNRPVTNDASLDHEASKELHRFPRERIVTLFERRSWLSAGGSSGIEADEINGEHPAAATTTMTLVNGREFHQEPVSDYRSEEGCSESELDSTMSDVRSDIGSDVGSGAGSRERVRLLDALREKASIEGHLEIVVQEAQRGRAEVAQLQSRLSTARSQMAAHLALSRAAGQEVESMRRMLDDAARRLHDSEDLCVGLREALDTRAVEVAQSKAESAEAEAEARRLRIALQEAKVDAESRDSAVAGLKAKVAELHGLLEESTRVRSQTECELQACRHECASESKMKEWYRNRVESLQEARQLAQREALAATADAAEARATAQRLRFEGERLGKQLADVQQRAVREKENLVHHLETIEADVREREAAVLQQHIAQSSSSNGGGGGGGLLVDRIKVVEAERARLAEEAYSRTQLELLLEAVKSELAERAESQSRAEREAAVLASKVVVLQKTVDDDRLELDAAYERHSRLEGKCRELESALRESHELTNSVRRESVSLEVELSSARKERSDMDSALLEVRANVTKLDGRMRRLRDELALKSRAHDALVQEKTRLEDELSIRESALERRRNREAHLEHEVQQLREEASRLKKSAEFHEESDSGVELATAIDAVQARHANDSQEIGCQTIENVASPLMPHDDVLDSAVVLLTRNLNEALEAKKRLESDLEATVARLATTELPSSPVEPSNSNSNVNTKAYFYRKRVAALEKKFEAALKSCDAEKHRADRTQELLIEAEKEKGRLLALSENAESLRQHAVALEASLGERDNEVHALESLVSDSTERGQRDAAAQCQRMEELEKRLGSEQSTNRELRRQVFKEMCDAKDARKTLANTKESLEETGRILESARSRIQAVEAEASATEKTVAELKLERTELKNRVRKLESELDAVRKELEECHAKDDMLADQVKSVGWHLHQKSQEIVRLQDEARDAEARRTVQLEAARQAADGFKREAETVAAELSACSKEKFSYRARLMALTKATKMATPPECQGRPDEFLIESPAPYDESLVTSLLQQSLESLPSSRPLSHLRLCLDTLKQEMAILQRQLLEHDD